jgi:hypothetical protein
MKIQFVKKCGHHQIGVEEHESAPATQYIVSGFAKVYVEPKKEKKEKDKK